MKSLKKYFETQEGCDEVEFRQVGWFMPLSVVLAIGYVVIAIILYVLGAHTSQTTEDPEEYAKTKTQK